MDRENGPVIFTALYVAALILTWVSLFSIERFGATEFKAWAPLIQAVLSAIAIFSAWLLQDLKRKADRRDSERDTQVNIRTATRLLEEHMAHVISVTIAGRLTQRVATSFHATSTELEAMLRQLNLAHLPNEDTMNAASGMMVRAANFSGMLSIAATASATLKPDSADAFERAYEKYYSRRTTYLNNCNFTSESGRRLAKDIKPLEKHKKSAT